jgi:hypothetical protein
MSMGNLCFTHCTSITNNFVELIRTINSCTINWCRYSLRNYYSGNALNLLLLSCIMASVMLISPSLSFMFMSLCRVIQSFRSCLRVLTSSLYAPQCTTMSASDSVAQYDLPWACCYINFCKQTRCLGCLWFLNNQNTQHNPKLLVTVSQCFIEDHVKH